MTAADLRTEPLPPQFAPLLPLAQPKRPPGAADWLAVHPEPGQSYAEYVREHPRDPRRRTVYLRPVGDFTPAQREAIARTADYLRIYFGGLPVNVLPDQPLTSVPPAARRRDQILTTWVLDQLARQRPDDALALIALTAVDLYPDPSWNFVFGQASLTERVGVWSLWRNGTPGSAEYLRRTIMTAAHELTHMLGVQHCTAWECLMNGSNHQAEKDARPLALCPHDLAKLCFALGGCDLRDRLSRLARFCRTHGLAADAARFEKELAAL